jgi:hypothetical protein
MIIIATLLGVVVGTVAALVMHPDIRAQLGLQQHSAIAAGIFLGGLTGLMGGVMMAV